MTKTTEQAGEKKGKGCFCVPTEALAILFAAKATAWQIGAYLTLARYTDSSGKFSTAGYKAIYAATGASPGTESSPGKARELIRQLLAMGNQPVWPDPAPPGRLLYVPDEWHVLTGEEIIEIPHKQHVVKWVLNDFDGGGMKVWFPNELVDGYGKFKQPLLRLKRLGDVAARLLVEFYRVYDMEGFGGVPPYPNVFVQYDLDAGGHKPIKSNHGVNFWKVSQGQKLMYEDLAGKVLCIPNVKMLRGKEGSRVSKPFSDALDSLERNGFVYTMVTVMDGNPQRDGRPIYDLHPHMTFGQPSEREIGVARRIDRIFAKELGGEGGRYLVDAEGRFRQGLPVLCTVGIKPVVVGVYRLRFRITNSKNHPVSAGWQRVQRDNDNLIEELVRVEDRLGDVGEVDLPSPN